MTDQLRISDSGRIEEQPLTWDQEPMWSVDTVQEGLFERSPFEQMRGQLAIEAAPFPYELRRFAHVVGRDDCKYHLVSSGADTAFCGKPTSEFNSTLAAGYEQRIIDAGQVCQVCARCEARS